MATISPQFILGDQSFVTKTDGDTATVVRTSTGKALSQTEIEVAGDYYNSELDEIDYAKIYNLKFGSDFLGKLGASDEWMAKALTDKTYKEVFKKATDKTSSNISFNPAETSDIYATLTENKDANGRSTLNVGGSILRYPINEDKKNYDYLKVCAYEYKPRGFNKNDGGNSLTGDYMDKGLQKKKGNHTVYLPMEPSGLQETNAVNWGDDTINAIEAAAANIAGSTIKGAADGVEQMAKGFAGATGQATKDILGGLGPNATDKVAAFFAGQAVGKNVFTRATGQVLNNNLELLFTGPSLRQFSYSFRFTPREETEARMVRSIIKMFKKAMAPQKDDAEMFLKSPHVFKLKYYFKN